MRRDEVVQSYLDLFECPNYLEIGVFLGYTFHALQAGWKVAVDPQFHMPDREREPGSEYHEVTSDAYFASLGNDQRRFSVIYLDGLHTFEQTLRDVMNAIEFLQHDGVIIIDDVLPNSYQASLLRQEDCVRVRRVTGGIDESWMGDVYRVVYFIRSFLPRFDYATVADNHGQLVMWRGGGERRTPFEQRIEDISRLQYGDFAGRLEAFNWLPNNEIQSAVRRARRALTSKAAPNPRAR